MNTLIRSCNSIVIAAALSASFCIDASATGAHASAPAQWRAIDPALLDEMRGGMVLPGGMMLSFGIERLVHVNGELVASMSLHIDDIARITPDQARDLARINEGLVVQVGQGTYFEGPVGAGALVVQNTLDGQDIRASTVLDLSVDTLGTLMQLNTSAALQEALVNAAVSP